MPRAKAAKASRVKARFSVVDAHDHPHGGRILRLRLKEGEAPGVRELRGCTMVATTERGAAERLKVAGFAAFGGRVSDARLARTGRVDVHVRDGAAEVEPGWTLSGPA